MNSLTDFKLPTGQGNASVTAPNVKTALAHLRTTFTGRKRISVESATEEEGEGERSEDESGERRGEMIARKNLPASVRKPRLVKTPDGTMKIKWGPGRPRKYPRPDDDPEVRRYLERQLAQERNSLKKAKTKKDGGDGRKRPAETETEDEEYSGVEEEEDGESEQSGDFGEDSGGFTSPLASSSDEEAVIKTPARSPKKSKTRRRSLPVLSKGLGLSDPIEEWLRAARHGQLGMLEAMLKKGQVEQVNVQQPISRVTALHAAAAGGHRDVIVWLLKGGADPTALSATGTTPIETCHVTALRNLMQLHLDRWEARLNKPQLMASWRGSLSTLRSLLKSSSKLESDRLGYTALHVAALRNDTDMIKLILSTQASAVKHTAHDGCSPLHDACRYGSPEACRLLLEAGALWSQPDRAGEIAPAMANKACCRVIRKWAKEQDISDPLLWNVTATQRYHQLDTEEEAEFRHHHHHQQQQQQQPQPGQDETPERNEFMPLGLSREERKLQQALALIEKNRVEQEGMPRRSKTRKVQKNVREAKERSSGEVKKSGEGKATKLSKAEEDSKSAKVKDSKSAKAESSKATFKFGKTEDSKMAARSVKSQVRPSPATSSPSTVLDTKWRDGQTGQSQLHRAAARDQRDLAMALLEADPELVRVRDHRGQTALHVACREGQSRVLKVLLGVARAIDDRLIDLPDDEGQTALHLATLPRHDRLVRVLLHANARLDLVNNAGQLAYELADAEAKADFERIRPGSLKAELPLRLPPSAKEERRTISLQQKLEEKRRLNTKPEAANEAGQPVKLVEDSSPKAAKPSSSPKITKPSLSPSLKMAAADPSEPLLLINVGSGTGSPEWYFLSTQIEAIWQKSAGPKQSFATRHPHLLTRLQTAHERQLLLSSPLMKRAPKLAAYLATAPSEAVHLLGKESVYKAFNEADRTLGGVSVIYVDLQRLLMRLNSM